MTGWIVVVVLYALGMGFFRLLGGFAAASDAIQRWGRWSAEKRRKRIEVRLRSAAGQRNPPPGPPTSV